MTRQLYTEIESVRVVFTNQMSDWHLCQIGQKHPRKYMRRNTDVRGKFVVTINNTIQYIPLLFDTRTKSLEEI